jgi:hypothetical protein
MTNPFKFDPGRFDIVADGMKFSFLDSEERYFSEHIGRYVWPVLVKVGDSVLEVSRGWLLINTCSWRDYSPDPLDYGEPLQSEPWSKEWMEQAVRECIIPNLSAHQMMAAKSEAARV